jgi:hypothetical protein
VTLIFSEQFRKNTKSSYEIVAVQDAVDVLAMGFLIQIVEAARKTHITPTTSCHGSANPSNTQP